MTMPSDESWSECPAGELAELQRSLKEQERRIQGRRRILIAAGGATLGIASVGVGIVLSRADRSTAILSCQETVDLLPKYVAGTITSGKTRKAVEMHLDHCQKCREYFEETY